MQHLTDHIDRYIHINRRIILNQFISNYMKFLVLDKKFETLQYYKIFGIN